jgi:hypothetical protein
MIYDRQSVQQLLQSTMYHDICFILTYICLVWENLSSISILRRWVGFSSAAFSLYKECCRVVDRVIAHTCVYTYILAYNMRPEIYIKVYPDNSHAGAQPRSHYSWYTNNHQMLPPTMGVVRYHLGEPDTSKPWKFHLEFVIHGY